MGILQQRDLIFTHLHLTGALWDQPPRDSFEDRVAAVGKHGCPGMGMGADELDRLITNYSADTIRGVLAEHNVTITEVEVLIGWDAPEEFSGPARNRIFRLAEAVGAPKVKATAVAPPGVEIAPLDELATKFGATTVLDPNVEGDKLVDKVTDLCKGEIGTMFSGGRDWQSGASAGGFGVARMRPFGPDFVIEAVGANRFPPKAGSGPDATGLKALQQAYMMTAGTGHLTTLGVYQGNLTLPAGTFAISGRTHHSGQLGGGANSFRDMPRFVRLIEKGLFDAKSMATGIYKLEQVKEAFQAAADRTTVTSIVAFS